tara:strand:- start:864 stop:1112 length:249 start_codon:yes stop_codon:yes gene_type:complete
MGGEWKCFLCDIAHGEQHYRTGSYNGVGMITVNGKTICSKCRRNKNFCVKCGDLGFYMDDSNHNDICEGKIVSKNDFLISSL